jgi:hypothetical protein
MWQPGKESASVVAEWGVSRREEPRLLRWCGVKILYESKSVNSKRNEESVCFAGHKCRGFVSMLPTNTFWLPNKTA